MRVGGCVCDFVTPLMTRMMLLGSLAHHPFCSGWCCPRGRGSARVSAPLRVFGVAPQHPGLSPRALPGPCSARPGSSTVLGAPAVLEDMDMSTAGLPPPPRTAVSHLPKVCPGPRGGAGIPVPVNMLVFRGDFKNFL